MDLGHPEHSLLGIVSLAIPEGWQHTVNHALDALLAFSGLSLVLGYGVLVLALPLLLLPTAFPELSRPRDATWSLVLAALAPLLLLNRLPVFSSAGLGELTATALMVRLAAEVGQGRWKSLTPGQRTALRHLPRWRRAGTDLVAAAVQAAKTAWSTTAQTGRSAWDAVLGQKSPVKQPQHDQSSQKTAQKPPQKPDRKQWVRPDSSDGVQTDQDGEASSIAPNVVPEAGAGAEDHDNDLGVEPSQPVAGTEAEADPGNTKDANGVSEDAALEPAEDLELTELTPVVQLSESATETAAVDVEQSTHEPLESTQLTQPVDGEDSGPGDAKSADTVPGDAAPEPVDQPSEDFAVTGGGLEPGEIVPEERSAPQEPNEAAECSQPNFMVAGTDNHEAREADAPFQDAVNSAPVDMVPEDSLEVVNEAFVGTKDNAAAATQEMTDALGAEPQPAQPAEDSSASPVKDEADVVVSNFDEVDRELRGSN